MKTAVNKCTCEIIIAYTVATYMEKFALPSHEAWLRHYFLDNDSGIDYSVLAVTQGLNLVKIIRHRVFKALALFLSQPPSHNFITDIDNTSMYDTSYIVKRQM